MSNQPRVLKVLAALLVSMTTGAIVLMALGNNPPSAGPFCLSSYYRLDSVEKAITSYACQSPDRWNCIQICYSGTTAGDIEHLTYITELPGREYLNYHFVICNGRGGSDGLIQPTEKWQRQWSIISDGSWYGSGQTIRICLIGDGKTACPTDCQIKRLETLVEGLCRKFEIQPESIYYPSNHR